MRKILLGSFIIILLLFSFLFRPAKYLSTLKEKYTDEYSHFVLLNNLEVHYKEKGEGIPIILIHGTSSSLHTWAKWENELSKKYKTYSIDMQGGGLTTPPQDNDYSIEAYINLIDAFVEEKGIDSFYLVGNSLGGHTAWEYAANSKNANKVKKLILVDPSGFFDENQERPVVFKLAQSKFLHSIIEYINVRPFVKRSISEVFYNNDLIEDELINRYNDLMRREGNRSAFFHKVKGIQKGEIEDLQKISCPTLIQWGKNDKWIPITLSSYFTQHIKDSKLIIYPECGHVPQEEIPLKSVKDVIDFLAL